VTDTFEATTPLPEGRAAGATVRDGGVIYYLGGWNTSMLATSDIFGFDIESRSWSVAGHLTTRLCAMSAAMGHNGLVYLIGGTDDVYDIKVFNKAWAWNPEEDQTTDLPDLPMAPLYSSAFYLDDHRVLYMGGYDSTGSYAGIFSLQTVKVLAELT
jgi:N-acetylneuraminic acid mutarotase